MKTNRVTKYLFKKQFQYLLMAYAIFFIVNTVWPLLLALGSGTLRYYSLSNELGNTSYFFFVTTFAIAYLSSATYENYKFLIQNGISRNTFFRGQIQTTGLLILIGSLVNEIDYWLIIVPIKGQDSIYTSLYRYFISNQIFNVLFETVLRILTSTAVIVSLMAFGSILSLLSKRAQRITLIAIPIILVVGAVFMIRLFITTHLQVTWLEDVFNFIIGYSKEAGRFNPIPLVVTEVLWSGFMLFITKIFFNKKQLKRE